MTSPFDVPDAEVAEVGEEDVASQAGVGPDEVVGAGGAAEVEEVIVADEDPLAAATAERDEYLDALRRLQAEFENYRKRVAKQQAEQADRAALSLVDKLLPVLDVLDLAATHLGDPDSDDGRALAQASALLNDLLAKEGLERIDPAGEPFDPTAHEAVGKAPAEEADETTTGTEEPEPSGEMLVAQVMRAGYRWRGRVIRPAMVLVRG